MEVSGTGPPIKDIIPGVILLAARGKEPMPLAKGHSIVTP